MVPKVGAEPFELVPALIGFHPQWTRNRVCVVIDVQVLDGVLDVSVIPADPVADQDRYVRARQGHEESCLQTRVLVYIVCLVLHYT